MKCPGCGSSLWDGIKCPACGRLGTDITPRSLSTDLSIPFAGLALFAGAAFLIMAVLAMVGVLDSDRSTAYFFGGIALFVAGYQGLLVIPKLLHRLNELEMRVGRRVDSHERRLQELEKTKESRA
jgi:hypothetical protein